MQLHINIAEINEAPAPDTIHAKVTDNHDGSTRYDINGIVFTVGGPGLGRADLTAMDIVFLLSEAGIKGYLGAQFPSWLFSAFIHWLETRPAKTMKILKLTGEMAPELESGKPVEIEGAGYVVTLRPEDKTTIKTKYFDVDVRYSNTTPFIRSQRIQWTLMLLLGAHVPDIKVSLRLPFLMMTATSIKVNGEPVSEAEPAPLIAAIENGIPFHAAIALGDDTNAIT